VRILTVGNLYPPHHLGGYELVWRSAVRHLRARGHDVRVLSSDFRLPDRVADDPGENVVRALRWYWRDHEFPSLSMRERLGLERHNSAVLARQLAEFRPQLVSWWSMGGMSLSLVEQAHRAGLAANAVVCDDWLLYGPRVDAWTRALTRRSRPGRVLAAWTGIQPLRDMRHLGPVLFPSETTRRRALAERHLGPTHVCHQGADRELFASAPAHPWRWRLLYVGRIDRRKGIDLAVGVLAALPESACLTVCGSGDAGHLAELRRLAAELGVERRVDFTTRPRERLRELYAEADAVVFPVRWEEPWGLVPLEAMGVGTPVVATGAGGSGEYLVDGRNCLLFDAAGGPEALASRLRVLAADDELRGRLRAGGAETSRRFTEQAWNQAVEDLCRGAVTGAPRSAGA
jgi:glycosyltransferase involved in cell wall biosynthesis